MRTCVVTHPQLPAGLLCCTMTQHRQSAALACLENLANGGWGLYDSAPNITKTQPFAISPHYSITWTLNKDKGGLSDIWSVKLLDMVEEAFKNSE